MEISLAEGPKFSLFCKIFSFFSSGMGEQLSYMFNKMLAAKLLRFFLHVIFISVFFFRSLPVVGVFQTEDDVLMN